MKTGIFVVLLSSFFFAFVPNSAKIALDDGSSLFFLVFSRYAIGGLILFLFIILKKENFSYLLQAFLTLSSQASAPAYL